MSSARFRGASLGGAALAPAACTAEPHPPLALTTTTAVSLHDVSADDLRRLAEARIFFGHQSVGYNLIDGVREVVAADPRVRLRIVESRDVADAPAGAFLHASIGRNVHPHEKDADFRAVLASGFGAGGDIAFYKYCYVDVQPSTDVDALFAAYVKSHDMVRARWPRLTIVHLTMPLMVSEGALRSRWHLWRVGYSQRALNVKRNAFNRLLLARYGASGLVFDLARLESTRPDGTRERFALGADTVYSLVPDYTDDGGHLHARSRRPIAEQLIAFLARVNAARVAAAAAAPAVALSTSASVSQ